LNNNKRALGETLQGKLIALKLNSCVAMTLLMTRKLHHYRVLVLGMAKFAAVEFIEGLGMIWLSYDMSLAGLCSFSGITIVFFKLHTKNRPQLNHFSALFRI
jgi:hypothetical protein